MLGVTSSGKINLSSKAVTGDVNEFEGGTNNFDILTRRISGQLAFDLMYLMMLMITENLRQ